MASNDDRHSGLRAQSLALAVGLISGLTAWLANVPLPWMLGAMIGNTVAAMSGLKVAPPMRLRPLVIPVIGVMLGSALTAEILRGALHWLPTLMLLPVFLAAAAGASYLIYRRLGGYDPVTAYYSAMPGGLNEMLILGTDAGGDGRKIALSHAVRILIVIVFVVLFFGFFLGVSSRGGGGRTWVGFDALNVSDMGWLIAAAVVGVPFGKAMHLPAGNLLGPMILSGAAHVLGLVEVPPPTLIIIAAQVVLGTIIGCRFLGTRFHQIRGDMVLGAISTASMLAVAVVFAAALKLATGTPLSQAFLAYSPGGLTEMSLLALAMGQEVAYVSVTHIMRIMMVVFAAPLAFGAVAAKRLS